MKRDDFLRKSITGGLGLACSPLLAKAELSDEPVPYKIDLVKEFVIAGHGNLTKVQTMLTEFPNLIFSTYDWGNGDFETALEGAGHVGNKEIAKFLINEGARANIFVMTMLGKTNLVKPVLDEFPRLLNAKGPHGFTLLHHAQKGGKDAEELLSYLQEKGLKETQIKIK